jgi:hypothetical protein
MGCNTSKDVAVGFVLFNPNKSKRIIMNYLYTKNTMEKQGIPTFTLELVFDGNQPEVQEDKNVFHVHSNSVMFHKERLCRLLEQKIPQTYTKLLFCDADIIFRNKNWYQEVSKILETHDIVHPFSEGVWKDLTYKQELLKRKTSLLSKGDFVDPMYHPGFVWGFRRDWYNKVGFFDYAITGSGDTLSCAGWMGRKFSEQSKSYPRNALASRYNEFLIKIKKNVPRITYLEGVVEHLWHGSRQNRKYTERHQIIESIDGVDSILCVNEDGVFEFKEEVLELWNSYFTKYFEERNDDELSPQEDISKVYADFTTTVSSILTNLQTSFSEPKESENETIFTS